jgi:hypothetical protein
LIVSLSQRKHGFRKLGDRLTRWPHYTSPFPILSQTLPGSRAHIQSLSMKTSALITLLSQNAGNRQAPVSTELGQSAGPGCARNSKTGSSLTGVDRISNTN